MIDSKNITGPDPPEWREDASVTYFKDKLYYLGGWNPNKAEEKTNRVDVRQSIEGPLNNFSNFRFLELTIKINHLKYMT